MDEWDSKYKFNNRTKAAAMAAHAVVSRQA
jgi:hypothetical protein